MKKTLIILLTVISIISCNSTKDLSRVRDSIQYLHRIDSLKSVIEVLKMRNKTDSLQILLDFYQRKRTLTGPVQGLQSFSPKQEDVIRRLSGTSFPVEKKQIDSPKVFAKPTEKGVFKDKRDGQTYKWVKIGKQTWMAQNLNYMTHSGCWTDNNDPDYRKTYGLLYDFDQIKEACPKGWHVPTEDEWQDLASTISSGAQGTYQGYDATCLIEGGDCGFNIRFGGLHCQGWISDLGKTAWYWTSTRIDNPIHIVIVDKYTGHIKRSLLGSAYACSLRCVKDVNNLK